jgi:hypothetical protein
VPVKQILQAMVVGQPKLEVRIDLRDPSHFIPEGEAPATEDDAKLLATLEDGDESPN